MTWNKRIRWFHRLMAVIFTVTVIACFVVLGQGVTPGNPAFMVFYTPLLPLALLLGTGLYLFVLPYVKAKR
ncbi:MAG: hypothetical protein ACRD0P_06420 [Stackebrandtia sp.]